MICLKYLSLPGVEIQKKWLKLYGLIPFLLAGQTLNQLEPFGTTLGVREY